MARSSPETLFKNRTGAGQAFYKSFVKGIYGQSERPKSQGNSTALDQWRGVALVLVLVSHGFFFTNRVQGIGRIGVNLFFFISGILVFRSLSKFWQSPRKVTLEFWKRRFLRLAPALIAYLVLMTGLVWYVRADAGIPDNPDFSYFLKQAPYAVFFLTDYANPPLSLGHLWSIAVEMQFYLLAPGIVFLGGTGRRRALVWGAILIALMALGASEVFRSFHQHYQFQFSVWPMMLGFMMEYLKNGIADLPARWILHAIAGTVFLASLSVVLMILGSGKGIVVIMGTAILAPCFLCYVTSKSIPGFIGKLLEWLGERTYSIYLWQQPLTICGFLPTLAHPLGALLSTFVGAISYWLFERPFLSQKRKAITSKPLLTTAQE